MINRRTFVATSLAAGAAASAGLLPGRLRAQPKKEVTTALSWIANVQHAGYWVGLEKGYFAAEGLDARHVAGGPNAPQPLVVVSAGKAQIGQANWLPFLDAVAQGNDFVIIASNFPISAAGLISLPGKPITRPKDLVGARILAQGPNEKTTIEATLALNGLPNDYTFIPAGFSPEPLLAKQGDAYFCFVTNQPIALERMGMTAGKDFIVTKFDSLGYRVPTTLFFAKRETVEKERAMLVGYLRALAKGWTDNAKNPAYAAELTVNKYGADLGLDLKQQTRQNELQIPLTRVAPDKGLFWLPPDLVAGSMYAAAKASGRTSLPDPKKIVDMSLLEEALKGV
jgi:ABC-type nitrate/sulfonate/bicarbonate transport system substrate-binding protein